MTTGTTNPHAYLVGAGIATLSAAAFLIRDAGFDGADITILEEMGDGGGSWTAPAAGRTPT